MHFSPFVFEFGEVGSSEFNTLLGKIHPISSKSTNKI
jgi:hypothetical protein